MEIHAWHESPVIRVAPRAGRRATDIGLVSCDRCGAISPCTWSEPCACEWCGAGLAELTAPAAAEVFTLAELWDAAEAAEGDPP